MKSIGFPLAQVASAIVVSLPLVLHAEVVFEARFETPGSLAADIGTLGLGNGNFSRVSTYSSHPLIDFQSGAAFFDATGSGTAAGYSAKLGLTDTIALDGASVSVDYVHRRSVSANRKSHYVTAYDSAGLVVFQLKLVDIENDLANTTTQQRQVPAYLDPVTGESVFTSSQIAVGSAPDSNPLGDDNHTFFFGREGGDTSVNESQAGRFIITTTLSGWTLEAIPRSASPTLAAFTTVELPFVDPAVGDIARVVISGETVEAGGFWDNLIVEGDASRTTLSTSLVAPITDLILSQPVAGSYTTIFDPDNSEGDRGQSILLPEIPGDSDGWLIDAITVVTAEAKDFSAYPNARLKAWVFAMPDSADANNLGAWNGTDGLSDGQVFDGTGVTEFLLNGHEVPLDTSLANGEHLRLAFNPPLLMEENRAYGFLLSLDDGDAGAGISLRLAIQRDNTAPQGETYADGKMLALTGTGASTGNQTTDDLKFLIQGSPAPASLPFDPQIASGPAIDRWGWDLKGGTGLTNTPAKAETHFGAVPANLIRIPIYCEAHSSDGSVDDSFYDNVVLSLTEILAVNPEVEIFASLKLLSGSSFLGPSGEEGWITAGTTAWPFDAGGSIFGQQSNRPNPEFYSQMIADFFDYMAGRGVSIDYIGLNNETDGALGVSRYIGTVDLLKTELGNRGYNLATLKFIAPDAFDPANSVTIVNSVASNSRLDTIDIVGSHFYPDSAAGTRDQWTSMSAASGGKELWHTEVHLNPANANNGDGPELNITRMRRGLGVAFASNMAGVNSLLWWQGGGSNTRIDETLKRRVVQTTLGAHPILSPAFDEQDSDIDAPFYQGYRKADQLTFWIANPGAEQSAFPVRLESGLVVENTVISGTYWAGPGNTINDTNSGAYAITPRADRRGFWIDHIPANSVGVIELSYSSPVTFSSTYPGMSEGGDENQNGLSNYFDYAAGFDPATPGLTASRPGITVAVTGVDYTHTMRSGANDVFIDYEYSTTLAEPWDPLLSADYTLTEVDQTVERRHRSLKLDPAFLAGKPKLFLRHRFLSTAP